jgi:hypothetical protein
VDTQKNTEPTSLVGRRARKFLRRLADHPFIALVVNDNGSVEVFSKGITKENIQQIREALKKEIGD